MILAFDPSRYGRSVLAIPQTEAAGRAGVMTYRRLAAMDADQLAAWVCLHPNPNRAEREALARLLEEMPFQGWALVLGGAA